MKVSELEAGQIFTIGNTLVRPKLKLKTGFVDMVSRYVYVCKGEVSAEILTETQLRRIRSNWGMTQEEFERYKQILIEKHKEVK